MANEYHDEEGKFCSRNEMAAIVDRLEKSGDIQRYSNMKIQLLEADNKNAQSRAELYKEALNFVSSGEGYNGTEQVVFGAHKRKDFASLLRKAETTEELRTIYALNPGGLAEQVMLHPAADDALRTQAMNYFPESTGGYNTTRVSILESVANDNEGRIPAAWFDAQVADGKDLAKTIVAFPAISEEKALALTQSNPEYIHDYVDRFGYRGAIAPAARAYVQSSTRATEVEKKVFGKTYCGWGNPTDKAASTKQRRRNGVLRVIAMQDPTPEAFELAVEGGYHEEAAVNKNIDAERATRLLSSVGFNEYNATRRTLLENKKLPAATRQALENAKAEPIAPEPTHEDKESLAHAKGQVKYDRGWNNESSRKYTEAQARYDSAPSSYRKLQNRYYQLVDGVADGTNKESTLEVYRSRMLAAEKYQQRLADQAALGIAA